MKSIEPPVVNSLATEFARLRELGERAAVLGMAAYATYGIRDANGLTGQARTHFRELWRIRKEIGLMDEVKKT